MGCRDNVGRTHHHVTEHRPVDSWDQSLASYAAGLRRQGGRGKPLSAATQRAYLKDARAAAGWLRDHPAAVKARILERLTEPERTVVFRVVWEDDRGEVVTVTRRLTVTG